MPPRPDDQPDSSRAPGPARAGDDDRDSGRPRRGDSRSPHPPVRAESERTRRGLPLEAFRARARQHRIHPAERLLLWVVCAHLVFLPWAIGGMRVWSQFISLGLAVLGLAIALMPRRYTEEHTHADGFRLIMWPKLVRFPIFWFGLALLGMITVQGFNPAWLYETDGKGWWMKEIPHTAWLPAGVSVPFALWGPWRMLLIYASVWLTLCTLWVGFTRRRTLQQLFIVLAANGLALALLGIAQRLLGNGKMFWFWDAPASAFFASFVYKNHAGSYLNLALAVSCGLAGWYYLRGQRRMEKSNPSGVLVFFSTCIAVSVLTSYARGATLVMLAFLCLGIIGFIVHQVFAPPEHRRPIVAVVLVLIFGFFLKTGMDALRTGQAWERLKRGVTREDFSLEYREMATAAALDMLKDHGLKGAGAGSFRFLFPIYQHRNPQLVATKGRRMFWEQAHNDVVQFPIELGLSGMLLLALSAGYLLLQLLRAHFWANPLSLSLVLVLGFTGVYAWWDFPLQNPAILVTFGVLGVAAAMWARFEEAGSRA